MDSYVSNKDGLRISPSTEDKQRDVEMRLEELKLLNADLVSALGASPMPGESQSLTNSSANTDGKVGVVPGATYVFTSLLTGGYYFGLADTQVAGNVLWCCPLYNTIIIKIPAEYNELHFATTTGSEVGYLRRIA